MRRSETVKAILSPRRSCGLNLPLHLHSHYSGEPHGKESAIVAALADCYGWEGLGERIPLRCFTSDPSVASSLKFLRKTPWAREKVESLYLFMLRDQRRQQSSPPRP